MTILFRCGGSYVSGMEIIELAIMKGMAARGHRVHALVSGWNDGDFIERLEAAGIPYTISFLGKITLRKPSWMADTLRHLPEARRIARRLVRELQPDLAVICNRDALFLLQGALGGTPVVFHVHEQLKPRWARAVGRTADHLLIVSEFIREQLVSDGVARHKTHVVQNGVELAEPRELIDRTPVIGICGQVGPWKGHDDLIEALTRLAAQGLSFELKIYGRGDDVYVRELKRAIDAGGWSDRAEWMGFERNIDRMYSGLDILAVPSRSNDPFPTTVLEAGARGLPVVGTLRGGIPEMIVAGETGLLVPSESPGPLGDALASLLKDPTLRRSMGEAARARVEANYLTKDMIDRFEATLTVVV